jgi:reactive intermediate/imine deaminase
VRRHIVLKNRRDNLPYSDAVLLNDTLYLSGRVGLDPATGNAPDDIDKEITLALDEIKALLNQAGMEMDDIVSMQVFCTDPALYDRFNAHYRGYFKDHLPARAFVGAGYLLRGGHFELVAVARRA